MGRNWAIAIGINNYRNLQRLHYAQRDAEAVRDYFQQELKFEQVFYFAENSLPIPQEDGAINHFDPTYATLRRFLRVAFEQPVLSPGDNLWFFFAGHGVRHEERDYLMPIDADPGDVETTAIPVHYVTERLRRCGADNIVLLVDACRSGGRRDGLGIGSEKQQGVISFFSCSPQESSYEIAELQQGSFTYALLESLRIQGEGNCATVERLNQRLQHRVPELNRQYSKPRQQPYAIAEPATKLHLILLLKQATLTDVLTLKNEAMTAELKQDFALAEQLWIRVLAISPADPAAIEGIKRLSVKEAGFAVPPRLPRFEFDVVTVNASGQVIRRDRRQAEYFVEKLGNGVGLEMVSIPAGIFAMGSPEYEEGRENNEDPQHHVTVPAFFMGKYPVTQAQWQAISALPKIQFDLNPTPSHFPGADRPVEQVSWKEAVEFCDRLSRQTGRSYRLPTEAEWEYACRAGTRTPFYFGETITPDLVNFDGNFVYGKADKGEYQGETMIVGAFPPNAFGLYDLHGNVLEWCLDRWHPSYEGAPIDGSTWLSDYGCILRGGSWLSNLRTCRSAARDAYGSDDRYSDIGFRVVCEVRGAL